MNFQYIHYMLIMIMNVNGSEYLKKIDVECFRQCDSHFSGSSCWEKSFRYFSNQIMSSLVEFGNSEINNLSNQENVFQMYQKIKNKDKDDSKSNLKFVKHLVVDLDEIFNETVKKIQFKSFDELIRLKCPIECNISSLVVWKSLFGSLMSLTMASLIFVAFYIIFFKIQYRALKKNNNN